VNGVGSAEAAVLLQRKFVLLALLVSGFRVVPLFTFGTGKGHDVGWHGFGSSTCEQWFSPISHSRISMTTPAPTVLPPSRMAKRSSFSRATGVINSTVISTLSPGMIISTPSGNFSEPVTSVVRK